MALAGADATEASGRRERYVVEHRVRRHDGVYRAMRARAVPVHDPAGHVREWVGVHDDVTAELAAVRSARR
jgi:PAS domain S-box-containing protein